MTVLLIEMWMIMLGICLGGLDNIVEMIKLFEMFKRYVMWILNG